jgi:hypothetical protein
MQRIITDSPLVNAMMRRCRVSVLTGVFVLIFVADRHSSCRMASPLGMVETI